jgi:hypothetical protein
LPKRTGWQRPPAFCTWLRHTGRASRFEFLRPRGNGNLEPGMNLIVKPFGMSEFANRVRELIKT